MTAPRAQRLGIAFYGKGGVGKSTVASHVCTALNDAGMRVLLLGCDPKQDVSSRFAAGAHVPTLAGSIAKGRLPRFADLRTRMRPGLDLVETGGAEPGTGCAGRGVSSLVQLLERDAIEGSDYDMLCFDVLGDLVCGGFVAPLRAGFVQRVYVVSSEEVSSLFVVNNVAKLINQPYNRGVSAGGIVFNLKNPNAPLDLLREFAAKVNLEPLIFLRRDPLILEAETQRQTVLDTAPHAPIAETFRDLAARIQAQAVQTKASPPTPMDLDDFWDWVRERGAQL